MNLIELQRGLRAHILSGDAFAPHVASHSGAAPETRLEVYHHAYRAQLVACLRDTFEKTHAWLGDEPFDDAARRHIEAHPPSSWTLGDYGFDFPATLHALYPDDPEVAELAWLDWSLRRAFDGPDAEPISQEALAAIDWDAAVLVLAPTLTVGEVATNCAAIWGAIAEDQTPPRPPTCPPRPPSASGAWACRPTTAPSKPPSAKPWPWSRPRRRSARSAPCCRKAWTRPRPPSPSAPCSGPGCRTA